MSEIAKRSQSALPECMAPDGAEPCKGYSHLYLSALNVEQNLNNRIAELEAKIRRREAALDSFDAVERARQAENAKLREDHTHLGKMLHDSRAERDALLDRVEGYMGEVLNLMTAEMTDAQTLSAIHTLIHTGFASGWARREEGE